MSETELGDKTPKILFSGVWEIQRLIPYEMNHKKHTEETVSKLARTMEARGQITPVIVDRDGVIIAGHGRRQAAMLLGWKKIRVVQLDVDGHEARAMRLADNFAVNTNYDTRAAGREVIELAKVDVNFDTESIGLNSQEAATMAPDLEKSLQPNGDVIVEDITETVEEFQGEGDRSLAEADDREVNISKTLGFSKVLPAQARTIKRFLATVREETGEQDNLKALIAWIEQENLA